ncbi:MAG TPA: integrase core domain-containing protein [Candidatus Dormibacteraeota bacterium]|nr:integrase core domain-containing protein [Candidatus Dormibacteraeota bacterium]
MRRPTESAPYTSESYTKVLDAHRIRSHLARLRNCWDNAVAGSFLATVMSDLIYRQPWRNRAAVRRAIFEYIESVYNPRRIHSSVGNRSPAAIEQGLSSVAQSA